MTPEGLRPFRCQSCEVMCEAYLTVCSGCPPRMRYQGSFDAGHASRLLDGRFMGSVHK